MNDDLNTLALKDETPRNSEDFMQTWYRAGGMSGSSCMKGDRPEMQDFVRNIYSEDKVIRFHAIYDGHGKSLVASFLRDVLHKNIDMDKCNDEASTRTQISEAFKKTDKEMFDYSEAGSTAAVALMVRDELYFANVGDSRGVLCSNGVAMPLSTDHTLKNESERSRVQALLKKKGLPLKEYVKEGRVRASQDRWIAHWLITTRAFGYNTCNLCITAEPEINYKKLKPEDTFMIIASDGLWDVFTSQSAVDLVKQDLCKENPKPEDFGIAAKLLRDAAYIKGSKDNISVTVIGLKQSQQQ